MIRYCPHCDERMTSSVIDGIVYYSCYECEYWILPLTREDDSGRVRLAAGPPVLAARGE